MEQKCILSEERTSLAQVGRYTYCQRFPTGRKCELLQPVALEGPQPTCYVCRNATIPVALDTNETTLQTFVDVVLKKKLGFIDPAVDKGNSGLVDSEDEGLARNLPLTLAKLPAGGVVNGTLLCVNDFQIDLEVNVEVRHKPNSEFDEKANPERVDILTGAAAAAAPAPAVATHHDFVSQNDENAGPPAAKKARTDA